MSTSMENSIDFEVVEPSLDHHDDDNKMYVSASTVGDVSSQNVDSDHDEVMKLSSNERNARLIGRRIDVLVQQASPHVASQWQRGTIMNFDKGKDVHSVLIDGEKSRKEFKLGEVIFRLVETEEEWVDIGEKTMLEVSASGHEQSFWS